MEVIIIKKTKNNELIKSSLGKRLRTIRRSNDYSQEYMANKLQMSTAYYGKIERGINTLSVEKLLLLYELFNIDLHFLLTGDIENLIHKFTLDSYKINIDVFFSGEALLYSMRQDEEENYDLIFLDVEMRNLNGIETAHEIRKFDKNCLIIFITTYVEFALNAFEVNTFRFLSKPINENLFKKYYLEAIAILKTSTKYFRYTFKRTNFKVLISDIIYFESKERLVYIHLNKAPMVKCYMKLKDIESYLVDHDVVFYRISQSLLVNPQYVYTNMYNQMILKNGEQLQVSTNRREDIKKIFCKIKGGEIVD